MAYDLVVRGGTLHTASATVATDIGVRGGKVAALGQRLDARGALVVDAAGCRVIPGGVDPHTHLDMPLAGGTTADDFATGTLAAACGGTTTIIDYAAPGPDGSLPRGLDAWHRKAEGRAVTDYGFHMTVARLDAARLGELSRVVAEGCPSFKVFTAYPGRFMLGDADILRVLRRARETGSLTLVHAENGDAIAYRTRAALAAGRTSPRFHPLTRPPEAEGEAAQRAVFLAETAEAPLYVVHISSVGGMDAVRRARERGSPVFGETCPQYLFLSDAEYRRKGFAAAKFVCSPPLRPKVHAERLWEGLRAGWLQTVGTDHCSFDFRRRDRRRLSKDLGRGDFTKIPNGLPSIESRMLLLWDAVARGLLTPQRFVEAACTAPAKIFGLFPRKGTIAPGSDADIVVIDPRRRHRFAARTHRMRVDYDPYEGRTVAGAVKEVLIRGRRVVSGFRPVSAPPRGIFLRRARCPARGAA